MSEPAYSGSKKSSHQVETGKDDLVNTPINIARARHASTYGPSVMNNPAPASARAKSRPAGQTPSKSARPSKAVVNNVNFLNSSNSCLWVSLLGLAFIVGGVLGGVVGGGMLLWAGGSNAVALFGSLPTATPLPIPTPAPAATLTPTPSPEPVDTPSVEDVIAAVIPSVVTVINQHSHSFSLPASGDEGRIVGSGVIVDERGYIATNNHVVDGRGDLRIVLADGREAMAELVAANPAEDLAVLKIDLPDLKPISWGDSDGVRAGQMVYAIGSPLGDFPNSVSFGIVSGLNRALEIDKFVIDGLIQTDAAINRGSSGGPLINLEGKVVGINTFIIRESEERGIAEGIAFSIPAANAKSLLIPWIAAHSGESVPIPVSGESN